MSSELGNTSKNKTFTLEKENWRMIKHLCTIEYLTTTNLLSFSKLIILHGKHKTIQKYMMNRNTINPNWFMAKVMINMNLKQNKIVMNT